MCFHEQEVEALRETNREIMRSNEQMRFANREIMKALKGVTEAAFQLQFHKAARTHHIIEETDNALQTILRHEPDFEFTRPNIEAITNN